MTEHRVITTVERRGKTAEQIAARNDPLWVGVRIVSPNLVREVGIQARLRMLRHVALWSVPAVVLLVAIWFAPGWLA